MSLLIKSIEYNLELFYPTCEVWITVNVVSSFKDTKQAMVNVSLEKDGIKETISIAEFFEPGENTIDALININEPELWYPNNISVSPVYELSANIEYNDTICDTKTRVIGVRTLDTSYGSVDVNDKQIEVFACKLNKKLSDVTIEELKKINSFGFNTIIVDDIDVSTIYDYATFLGLIVLDDTIDLSILDNLSSDNILDIIKAERLKGNDILVDYEAVKDMPVFAIKQALEPIVLWFVSSHKECEIYCLNNTIKTLNGVVKLSLLNVDKNVDHEMSSLEVNIEPFSVNKVCFIKDSNKLIENPTSELFYASLTVDNKITAKDVIFEKEIEFKNPEILLSRVQSDIDVWHIVFTAKEYVRCLEIITDYEVSNNYFDLLPNEAKEVVITGSKTSPKFTLNIKK